MVNAGVTLRVNRGKKHMLSYDEEGGEVFFDTVEYMQNCDSVCSEDSVSLCSELVVGKSEYEVWRNELVSVQERRERFLHKLGFSEFASLGMDCCQEIDKNGSCGSSPEIMGLERITECSGAVSSSWVSVGDGGEEDSFFNRRDPVAGTKFVVSEVGQDGSARLTSGHELVISGGLSPSFRPLMQKEFTVHGEENDGYLYISKKKMRNWWKSFVNKRKGRGTICNSGTNLEQPRAIRTHVQHRRKRFMEFTGLYMGQEIQAHKGFIWTMKFSPDGRYLATGGEDGVVCIWRVTSTDASCNYFTAEGSSQSVNKMKEGKFVIGRKNSNPASVVIPKRVFKIEESPAQEFYGHISDVLDLSWSKSNYLLSSSKDKTVRLWQVGCNECLNVFQHNNFVTCIQFNPVHDGYFISGSIDGKVRLWGVSERRVVGWADVRDIVTAICYHPDGQGCIVGTITGVCRFYDASGNHLKLDAQICIQGRKKSSGNRITGIQFFTEDSLRFMITTADSKVRIFYGVVVIHKYRALRKSGSQMSASFTSSGRHIISIGEDSHVYIWNYDGLCIPSSKEEKSVCSCEHFFSEGVSVAIPWSGMEVEHTAFGYCSLHCPLQTPERLEAATKLRDSEHYSLGGWFSMDGSSKGSATWPEEKLPLWTIPVGGHDHHHHQEHQQQQTHHDHNLTALSAAWGLVIVTAGRDGMVRTYHNHGLPVKL